MISPHTRKLATLLLPALLAVGAPAAIFPPSSAAAEPADAPIELSPFLDVFLAQDNVKVETQPVQWVSAIGKQQGLLVRDDSGDRLPALLFVADGPASDFARRSARELAEIGYVVLLVELDHGEGGNRSEGKPQDGDEVRRERILSQLSAAVRWLRRRDDVYPDRIGALGFHAAARWTLEAAAAGGLQAAALCDPRWPLAFAEDVPAALQHTAVLVVRPAADATFLDGEYLARLKRRFEDAGVEHRVLDFDTARTGFMDHKRDGAFHAESADRAWFEIYEYLGKHVEDAPLKALLAARQDSGGGQPLRQVASIADLMQAVNAPSGVRGALAQSLAAEPDSEKGWRQARARAALMTDAAELLLGLEPPKGNLAHWRRHAGAYRDAAAAIAQAADRRDYSAARQALDRLNTSCGKCHLDHR